MAFLGLILFFAIAALFVMPIVALVQTKSFARAFRDEMAGMMDRIRDLEAQLRKLAAERGPSGSGCSCRAAHGKS
jgi:4-hydroxybenzoate polyprenyltransferase